MKNISILFIFVFCLSNIFAQKEVKHPENDKTVVLNDNGTWVYKPETGEFKDIRNGKTYKTIAIGTQIWMSENLAFKTDSGSWAYNNEEKNVAQYGYLYNWNTALSVCPKGWHLPSDEEWKKLEKNLGMELAERGETGYRSENIGIKLKDKQGWEPYQGKIYSNNSSGFSALPGGYRYHKDMMFYDKGFNGYWWTSSKAGGDNAWYRYLDHHFGGIARSYYNFGYGFSVRCVKD